MWLALGLVGISALLTALLVVALPWVLSTPAARRMILDQANRVLRPGRLEVAAFRFSWFGPTRLSGIVLRDAQGDPDVVAPTGVWDRTLWQILFGRPRLGTLTLEQGNLDIELLPGTSDSPLKLDLFETLRPVMEHAKPATDLRIVIHGQDFRLRGANLATPVTARPFLLTVHRQPRPEPLVWEINLEHGTGKEHSQLLLRVDSHRWATRGNQPGDLALRLVSTRWPLDLSRSELRVGTRFDGGLNVYNRSGVWTLAGQGTLDDVTLTDSRRLQDQPRLDHLAATWDLAWRSDGWSIRQLNLDGEIGTLRATGTASQQGMSVQLDGKIDLVSMLALLPGGSPRGWDYRLDQGQLHLEANISSGPVTAKPEPIACDARLSLGGLVLSHGDERVEATDIDAHVRASLDRAADRIDLESVEMGTPYGKVDASGTLVELSGSRRLDVSGLLTFDWDQLRTELAERVEPDATIDGGPVAFHLVGPLIFSADSGRPDFDGEVRLPLRFADFYGMKLGPTTISARLQAGAFEVDPIEATLNGGRLALAPTVRADDQGGLTLQLAQGSSLTNAQINDEVSRRVLAFIVPTLAEATRVHGTVSVALDRAEIPLRGPSDRSADVAGQIVFHDVEFLPGPLATDLLDIVSPGSRPTLRLDKPVVMAIHDRKVYQSGLAIPLGNIAQIQMEGAVGFDQTIDLHVSIPITSPKLSSVPFVGNIASAVRPTIPISGTLSQPKIDREAFGREMGRMGLDIAGQAGLGGLDALIERLSRPPDPAEQARRQEEARRRQEEAQRRREERSERREERKLERQMRKSEQAR